MPFFDGSDDLDAEPTATTCMEFADREEQSVALAASARFVAAALRGQEELDAYRHVLTFYGGGGVGKTALSHRLERWLNGDLAEGDWGSPPIIGPVATVRWDMNASHGDVEALSLLLAFRAALPSIPGGWRVLDLALLSYFQAVRPGETLRLTTGSSSDNQMLAGLFEALASDIGYVFDLGTGLAGYAIKALVTLARKKLAEREWLNNRQLSHTIERCLTDVSPTRVCCTIR